MKINEQTLKKDIKKLEHQLCRNYGKKDFLYDFIIASSYDDILVNIGGQPTNVAERTLTPQVMERIEKLTDKTLVDVCKFFNTNREILHKGFESFEGMFTSTQDIIDNAPYHILNKMKYEDFKELLLAYFSQYGNRIYGIVKKYIDEERIELGDSFLPNVPGVFVESASLGSGYISVEKGKCLHAIILANLAHELGHAIDSETFLFPQKKKLYAPSDLLTETPSSFFEIGMLDFLQQQRVYSDDGHYLMIDTYSALRELMAEYQVVYGLDNFYLEQGFTITNQNGNYISVDGEEITDPCNKDLCDGKEMLDISKTLKYATGIYLALQMNELAKENREAYIKYLLNFTTSRKESSFEESLAHLGITKEQFETGSIVAPRVDSELQLLRKKCKY